MVFIKKQLQSEMQMKNYLNKILDQITIELELTESQEGAIEKAYNAVADWLSQNGSPLKQYKISIFPQGSINLGTVVKPYGKDDYDVDLVCLFNDNTKYLTAEQVKLSVGERLKSNSRYKTMLTNEGKRCWTMQYSDNLNFHMDILPAVATNNSNAICATHKENGVYRFISTNPHDYAEWFKQKMQNKTILYERSGIEKMPDYPRKTVLQKTVQLLKRHRDVMFKQDNTHAPISIIITTLVAKLYSGESTVLEFLDKVVQKIGSMVENRAGIYWVANPVNSKENFADKWIKEPIKKDSFFEWVEQLANDYQRLMAVDSKDELLKCLYDLFGQKAVDLANNHIGGFDKIAPDLQENSIIPYEIRTALSVTHRQTAPWKLPAWNAVIISATANGKPIKSGEPLDKGMNLKFEAKYFSNKPYYIKWQVTNTGVEARNCLRGDFYNSDDGTVNIRTESTAYVGIHYVQCFIISGNKCIAKSREFIVKVK